MAESEPITQPVQFEDILDEMKQDENLSEVIYEYERILNEVKKMQKRQIDLDFKAKILADAAKITAAKRKLKDVPLTEEIEKTRRLLNTALEKEKHMKAKVKLLRGEMAAFQIQPDDLPDPHLADNEENTVSSLLKLNENLTKERDQLLTDVVGLRDKVAETTSQRLRLKETNENSKDNVFQLQDSIEMQKSKILMQKRRKEMLQKELKHQEAMLETVQQDLKTQTQRNCEEQQKLEQQKQQLYDKKVIIEQTSNELEQLKLRNIKLQNENQQHTVIQEQMSLELEKRASELKAEEEEVNKLHQEISEQNKLIETTLSRIQQLEQQKIEAELERETWKSKTAALEMEKDSLKKQMEQEKRAINRLSHEQDLIYKSLSKANYATEKQIDLIKIYEQSNKFLKEENKKYREESENKKKFIYQLEQERDKYIKEASDIMIKTLNFMEDIKTLEVEILDYKKMIAETENDITQQEYWYEAAKSDRDTRSRHLIEMRADVAELKMKKRMVVLEIVQLKERITSQEAAVVAKQVELEKLEMENEDLKKYVEKIKQQCQETKQIIEDHTAEEKELLKIIDVNDAVILRKKRALEQVFRERDILRGQLRKRNNELAQLFEKIKVLKSTNNKINVDRHQKIIDIRQLQGDILRLREEMATVSDKASNVNTLRREVSLKEKELLKERAQCNALEREIETPQNVHQWRKLEATDPSNYRRILKNYSLQKLLLHKRDDMDEKDRLIQEMETRYIELKHKMAKQAGPEAAEQLQIRKEDLKRKTKELKALTAEMNFAESQAKEYKQMIDSLNEDLQIVKEKYFSHKRRIQQAGRTAAQL